MPVIDIINRQIEAAFLFKCLEVIIHRQIHSMIGCTRNAGSSAGGVGGDPCISVIRSLRGDGHRNGRRIDPVKPCIEFFTDFIIQHNGNIVWLVIRGRKFVSVVDGRYIPECTDI